MPARDATQTVLDEAKAAKSEPFHLFELFLATTIYATDAPFPISWGGNTYTALGHFIAFSGGEENRDLAETRLTVSLSGVDQAWISNVLEQNYVDRRLVVRRAFLAPGGGVMVDPVALFDGLCDGRSRISEDHGAGASRCVVTLEAGSHWSDFGRRPGRHANDNEQRFLFAGDGFFRFVSEINRTVTWGAVTPTKP